MKRGLLFIICLLGVSSCQLLPSLGTQATIPATLPPTRQAPTPQIAESPLATATLPPTSSPPTSTPIPAKPLLLVPKTLTDSGSKPSYSFKVRYPQFNSAVAFPGLQAFNQYAEQAARDLLASYQKNLKDTIGTPDPNFGSSFMEANYQVNSGTHGMLSIQYTVSDYWSGAAHPNSYTMVINFDLVRGKKFELQEIFLPGVNYLQALSDICSTDLKKRDRLEFPEGVLPKVENFQNWNFNDQGLLIFFDPYQVAAYALGPSQVVVPYSALKGMLNPAGPLGVFIK